MQSVRYLLVIFCLPILLFSNMVAAGDFTWMRDLNNNASANLSHFQASLSTRFHIGDVEVETVIRKVDQYADAYMVLRLHEISGRSIDNVLRDYQDNKGKGWGVIAKRLGIKPGSAEFHALKRGQDPQGYLQIWVSAESTHGKGNDKGKAKDKNKNQHKQKP